MDEFRQFLRQNKIVLENERSEVLQMPVRPAEQAAPAERAERDYGVVLERLRQAGALNRAADERARRAEAQAEELAAHAREQIRRAEAIIRAADNQIRAAEATANAAEMRLQDAEARLREAEERARDAQDWISRVFEIMDEEFSGRREPPRDPIAVAS
jgi:hypothetical protein